MNAILSCPHCGEAIVERRKLTRTEDLLLRSLSLFIADVGRQPTFEEIGEMMQWSSLGTVHEYMHKLADAGFLVFHEDLRDRRGPGLGWEIVA